MGAIGALTKPLKSKEELKGVMRRIRSVIEPHPRTMLVIGKEESQRSQIIDLIGGEDIQITAADTGQEALAKLKDNHYGVTVLDLDLPDMTGLDLIEEIKRNPHLEEVPVIAYVSKNLSKKDEAHLKRLGQTMNLKEVRSLERLLDETALFLHCDMSELSEAKRMAIQKLHETETVLKDKKILIVDDDIRNIFAMTSLLERYEMQIISAETGKTALEQLHGHCGY